MHTGTSVPAGLGVERARKKFHENTLARGAAQRMQNEKGAQGEERKGVGTHQSTRMVRMLGVMSVWTPLMYAAATDCLTSSSRWYAMISPTYAETS
jgi:hypothetical protein